MDRVYRTFPLRRRRCRKFRFAGFFYLGVFFYLGFGSCKGKRGEVWEEAGSLSQAAVFSEEEFDSFSTPEGGSGSLKTFAKLSGISSPLEVITTELTDIGFEEQIVLSRNWDTGNLEVFLISPTAVVELEDSVVEYSVVDRKSLDVGPEQYMIQMEDLDGGGAEEVFITGQSAGDGVRHAYVFQVRDSGRSRKKLQEVFHQESPGSFEIASAGGTYYISEQTLLGEDNFQTKVTDYFWDSGLNTFLAKNVRILSNDASRISETLKEIYSGGRDQFLEALVGLWALSGPSEEAENVVLEFTPDGKQLLFFTEQVDSDSVRKEIEIMDIVTALKTLWNRMNLYVRNSYIGNLQSSLYLRLEDYDTLHINVLKRRDRQGGADWSENWVGEYKRMGVAGYREYRERQFDSLQPVDFSIIGDYQDSEGSQYIFTDTALYLYGEESSYEGVYSLFDWEGTDYLEINVKEPKTFERLRRTYRLERVEPERETGESRYLLLYPVKLLRTEEVRTADSVIRLDLVEAD